MFQSSRIDPNMMNAPWLDPPKQITESELTALEQNYSSMLETIRNDTFGGIMPPKYNLNEFNNNPSTNNHNTKPTKYQNNIHEQKNNDDGSIQIFNDDEMKELQSNTSGLNISFHENNNTNESAPNLLSHLEFVDNSTDNSNIGSINRNHVSSQGAFMSDEINLSVDRVRMQLYMTSSSISPIPHATDNSIIDIDLNRISQSMGNIEDDYKNNLSPPFIPPSMDNNNNNNRDISESVELSLFAQSSNNTNNNSHCGRSEQAIFANNNNSNNMFTDINNGFLMDDFSNNSFEVPSTLSLEELNQEHSQIVNHVGNPSSVTSSMIMNAPSNSAAPISPIHSMYNNNNINFDDNNSSNMMRYNINDNVSSLSDSHSHQINRHRLPPAAPRRRIRGNCRNDRNTFSIFQNIEEPDDTSTTPTNVEARSDSLSVEEPRLQRSRNQNRRSSQSSNVNSSFRF